MRRREIGALLVGGATLLGCGSPNGFRYRAPITVTAPGPFVELALPVSLYGRAIQPELGDVRVVDEKGNRVAFALLGPRATRTQDIEQAREIAIYRLPPRPTRGPWASPLEVTVRDDQIRVSRSPRSDAASPAGQSGGWLLDLGPQTADSPNPDRLRFLWSGPAEFTAAFTLETSPDLTDWRGAPGGQLMALVSASGPLTQPFVRLPATRDRFVRIAWADPATAPVLTGATAVVTGTERVAIDPPEPLTLAPLPSRPGDSAGGLEFDLGGDLPIIEVTPRFATGNLVVPARVQGRSDPKQPWHELGAAVFYRLERGTAEATTSPPLVVRSTARYVRVVPDPRVPALDRSTTKLDVKVQLAKLVFAKQGAGPFYLEAGSRAAVPSALPATTLVPALDEERPRFGRATLGEWNEAADVARAADRENRMAALKPVALWGVLLLGIAGLGAMVWRLARRA